ncbi:MAG: hypothetical protein ABSD03_17650 [Vulcanimicrobiaceae bacterium]
MRAYAAGLVTHQFETLGDALRAGFTLFERGVDGYLVRMHTGDGWKIGWAAISSSVDTATRQRSFELNATVSAGDRTFPCADCALPVLVSEGDAGYELNEAGECEGDDFVHRACWEARCERCGEARGIACIHRQRDGQPWPRVAS